jgi:hypothetical protein
MGKLGLNSGYIGSDQRSTTNGVVGYDKFFLERKAGRFIPVLDGDPDAEAFFQRVIAAGGTLSATEQFAVTQLVIQMKTDGIWDKMKAIYPMVGASAAACAQNLKSSSFTGTFTAGWTFASTGATPNGTSAYFDTGFIPNTSLTLNSASFSIYCRNNFTPSGNQSWGCAIGASSLPIMGATFLTAKGINSYIYSYTTPDIMVSASGLNLAAMFLCTRTSSTSAISFRNSTSIASTSTNAQTTQPTNTFLFGALRSQSSIIDFNSFENAFAHIGDGLTSTQASDFYTAVQAFQTTLSRQV